MSDSDALSSSSLFELNQTQTSWAKESEESSQTRTGQVEDTFLNPTSDLALDPVDAKNASSSSSTLESALEEARGTVRKIVPFFCEEPEINRHVIFPLVYPDLYAFYDEHFATIWRNTDVVYDADQFDKLTPDEQKFIKNIIAFFAGSDGIVMENIDRRLVPNIRTPEVKLFYTIQNFMEGVHAQTYADLITAYVSDQKEREDLFKAINDSPTVSKKAQWGQRWIDDEETSMLELLMAFLIFEGIFFSGAFCSIFWVRKRNLPMQGLTKSNEWISRDEGIHTRQAIALLRKSAELRGQSFPDMFPRVLAEQMFLEALEIERQFICESLPVRLIGMNSDLMTQYLQFVANGIFHDDLGYSDRERCLFSAEGESDNTRVENPFPWMDMMTTGGKTNFFEQRVSEYSRAKGCQPDQIQLDDDNF